MRRLLIASLLLGLAACELVPEVPFTPVLNVQGFLPAGQSRLPLVHVNRTFAIDEPPAADFPGAEVTIRRGPDTVQLAYLARDQYTASRPLDLLPGDELELAVSHPGYDTVRGRTVIPDSFAIITPAAGDTVTPRDSLVWSASSASRGYYVSIKATWADSLELAFLYPNDTLPLNIPLFVLGRAPAGSYRLTIVAVDSNYFDWLRRDVGGPGGFNTSDSFGLAGGVGVFGSGFERSLEFCLRCDSASYRPGPTTGKPKGAACAPAYSRKPRLPSATRPWPATSSRSRSQAIPTGRASPPSHR